MTWQINKCRCPPSNGGKKEQRKRRWGETAGFLALTGPSGVHAPLPHAPADAAPASSADDAAPRSPLRPRARRSTPHARACWPAAPRS
jgi:hypothetical protein